ncbi:hypothetical protein NDU88_004437 [Pleurodeles waltl]|uniref:Uncharacterized protein n=1 Tax=Pleurodeles waltl TaxID=8319 RepID=A0AAV7NL23_PLEWA|nr:hypothetical protein NDU88_004437 [Pleurodeles waltl]
MEPSKVVQALKVLQEEGREDLIKDGVLEEAWVGLRRPKGVSAKGVSAAVAACTLLQRVCKKFKTKSALGRKVARSPQSAGEVVEDISGSRLISGVRWRGVSRFSRRQGASLARRIAAGGRGSGPMNAMSVSDRMGAQAFTEHARSPSGSKQAKAPLEKGGEIARVCGKERTVGGASKMAASSDAYRWISCNLEERQLGANSKMAAPIHNIEEEVVVISDDEEEVQVSLKGVGGRGTVGNGGNFRQRVGRMVHWIPRVVSPMLHRVRAWEAENQAVFRLGEQVQLVDRSGVVLRGTVCGETTGDGSLGSAYVSLDFRQADQIEGPSGCDTSHVLGGHGERSSHWQLGQLAGEQSLPVKVRAPLEHRAEGRVKPRAVYPTSQELAGDGPLGQRSDSDDVQPSTSRGAGGGLYHVEELLEYDDDVDEAVLSMQRGEVTKSGAVPRVVQGDHSGAHRRELVAGNLPRGEEGLFGSLGSKEVREVMGVRCERVFRIFGVV